MSGPYELVERILVRARRGEDVRAELAALPPELRAQVVQVLETERALFSTVTAAGAPAAAAQAAAARRVVAGPLAPLPGGGRWQVVGELGRGGMGVVYRARDLTTGRPVVLKFLAPEKAADEHLRRRFLREAQALQKIGRHPHVVHIEAVHDEPGAEPFIVMELVEGTPLADLAARQGRLAPAHAAALARDVALGLAAVHRHGLLHRDVKPGNVIVGTAGQAKVVDFGLAKDLDRSSLTAPGQLLGTAYYMAPEQWQDDGERIDARCDVFALGAVLYQLLTGRPPFDGDDPSDIMEAITGGDYPPPRDLAPDVPEELGRVVAQMLMLERRFRYARMELVAEDLERVLRGEPARVPALLVEGPEPRRQPLLPGDRLTIGRDSAACGLAILDPTVSREHAEVRREERGWVLRDLRSSHGTFVRGERLARSHALAHGDELRLGEVRLRFDDPCTAVRAEAHLAPVLRDERPEPVLHTLVAVRDPRAAAWVLEHLTPDRWLEARLRAGLAALLGDDAARAACARREERARHARAGLPGLLAELTGAPSGALADAWLAWWDLARFDAPPQVDVPRPLPAAQLRVVAGEAPRAVRLADRGALLVGRDPRCQLRLEHPTVSRLHATVYRLCSRLVVRDGGGKAGTRKGEEPVQVAFLEPGDVLALGDVRVALEAEPGPPPFPAHGPRAVVVDGETFWSLVDLRHPAAVAGLVGSLREPRGTWPEDAARVLFAGAPERAAAFAGRVRAECARRAAEARRALPALAGADAGDDPARWEALLLARSSSLPPQALPAGWLETTRTAQAG